MKRVGVAPIGLLVVCLALVLAPIAGVSPPDAADSRGDPTGTGVDDSPVGPGDGVENGVRYNDSLSIDASDGYNESELEAISSRTMARVEYVRNVEFESSVPVEFRSRDEFGQATRNRSSGVSTDDRLHQNAKFEALFLVGEETDAIRTRNSNTASGVLAYYAPGRDTIVIIGANDSPGDLDEPVLAQEFFHAFQFRHFGVQSYDRSTEEANNAALGLIEGDANLVQERYAERCRNEWDCLDTPRAGGGGGAGRPSNMGLYLLSYFPYSDGPPFVDVHRRAGGWAAVDALYQRPPQSSEQIIHPERYPGDEPRNVSVERTGSGDWHVLELDGGIDYATFGEAGLAIMLSAPAIESNGRQEVIPASHFFNRENGFINRSDPFNYSHRYTAGWDGDRLYPYVTDRSAETNETGYVWKITFDTPGDAREFATGYRKLLEVRGGETVDGYRGVWRIPSGPFADAFRLTRSGDTVVIVNGPRVGALERIRPRNHSGDEVPPPSAGDDDDGVAFGRAG